MGKSSPAIRQAAYLTGRAALACLSLLPLPLTLRLSRAAGSLFYRMDKRHRGISMVNLRIAFPDLPEADQDRIARGSYTNMGELVGLIAHFRKFRDPEVMRRLVRFVGLENYEAIRAEGRPVLFMTAHFGPWELLPQAEAHQHGPMSFIVRPLDHSAFDQLLGRIRTQCGNIPIPKKDALRKVLRTLAAGGVVGLLVDQNVQEQDGVFVDFFTRKACMTTGLAVMALRSNAAVLPAFITDDEEGITRYAIHIFPEVPISRTGNLPTDVAENTQRFAHALEEAIRRWPHRWLWSHRRWKTRPPEDPSNPYEGV